jgi:hypothetical protein
VSDSSCGYLDERRSRINSRWSFEGRAGDGVPVLRLMARGRVRLIDRAAVEESKTSLGESDPIECTLDARSDSRERTCVVDAPLGSRRNGTELATDFASSRGATGAEAVFSRRGVRA